MSQFADSQSTAIWCADIISFSVSVLVAVNKFIYENNTLNFVDVIESYWVIDGSVQIWVHILFHQLLVLISYQLLTSFVSVETSWLNKVSESFLVVLWHCCLCARKSIWPVKTAPTLKRSSWKPIGRQPANPYKPGKRLIK